MKDQKDISIKPNPKSAQANHTSAIVQPRSPEDPRIQIAQAKA